MIPKTIERSNSKFSNEFSGLYWKRNLGSWSAIKIHREQYKNIGLGKVSQERGLYPALEYTTGHIKKKK